MRLENITTEDCVLNDLAIAFESGCSGLIIDHLEEGFVFDSPKLKQPLNKQLFEVYIGLKFQKLKEECLLPTVRVVKDSTLNAPMMLELCYGDVIKRVNVMFDNGKLTKMEVI